jgi:Uma2 family endonuclease
MPAVVESYPAHVPPEYRRKYTREDCRVLAAAGLLDLERYELIDGELVSKMGKSAYHSMLVALLVEWLRTVFGGRFVHQEVSINLNPSLDRTNELEPDAIVLSREFTNFQSDNPTPADIRLLVEVSVSTREYDLGPKAARYAAAGITEYWVVDIDPNRIVVHRDPSPTGYQSIAAYSANEALSPLAAPHAVLRLTSLLP